MVILVRFVPQANQITFSCSVTDTSRHPTVDVSVSL